MIGRSGWIDRIDRPPAPRIDKRQYVGKQRTFHSRSNTESVKLEPYPCAPKFSFCCFFFGGGGNVRMSAWVRCGSVRSPPWCCTLLTNIDTPPPPPNHQPHRRIDMTTTTQPPRNDSELTNLHRGEVVDVVERGAVLLVEPAQQEVRLVGAPPEGRGQLCRIRWIWVGVW